MQRRAALWITGAFRTSPNVGVEAIAGLIPIHLHLRKLAQRSCMRMLTLHPNHSLHSLSGMHAHITQKPQSVQRLSPPQKIKVKGPLIEAADVCLEVSETLEALPDEDKPGCRILDQSSGQIRFEDFDRTKKGASAKHLDALNAHVASLCHNHSAVLVPTAASRPKQPFQSMAGYRITREGVSIFRAQHPSGLCTALESELQSIRLGVCKALTLPDVTNIEVFTTSLPAAHLVVDPSCHSGQSHSLAVIRPLR